MDMTGANKMAIDTINAGRDVPIRVRQIKYLHNIVEQEHRAIKRTTKPMLNFKSFHSAASVIAGIELMHMIRKGQFSMPGSCPIWAHDAIRATSATQAPPSFLSPLRCGFTSLDFLHESEL